VDYIVVRESIPDNAREVDGFESIPQSTPIDDILRYNEKRLRRQLQRTPTPTPTASGDASDSDAEDDDEPSEMVRIPTLEKHFQCTGTKSSSLW